jgi:hypothetical protein
MNRKANILFLAPLLALGVCEASTRAQAASDPVAVIASIYKTYRTVHKREKQG